MGHLERLKGIRDELLPPTVEPGQIRQFHEPVDGMNLQLREDGKQEFVGDLLWDIVDVLTFGVLEKKKPPKSNNQTAPPPDHQQTAHQNQSQAKKSNDSEVQISQSEFNSLVSEVGAMKKESQQFEDGRVNEKKATM